MNYKVWWVGLGIVCALSAYFVVPQGAYALETIPAFDARVSVNTDATLSVEERIVYNFGGTERHGIFRVIPVSYQAGSETYTADVSQVKVVSGDGTPVPFVESRGNGALTLKIGDPNTSVTGEQTYTISYVVHGPFLYWDDRDELYWNVTGSWPNTIKHASVLVDLPVGAHVLDASCYEGVYGSQRACAASEKLVNSERAGYAASTTELAAGEGLTVAITFPKGTISTPVNQQSAGTYWFLWPLFLPIGVLVMLVWLWYTFGRDPRGRGTIITEFTPPEGITPAMAGVLYNERLEDRELSGEIVRLAVEGYIKLHRIESTVLFLFRTTDYLIERVGNVEPSDPISLRLLERLFQSMYEGRVMVEGRETSGVLLSKMRHAFARDRRALEDTVYDEVVLEGLFPTRPDRVRMWYAVVGFLTVVVGVVVVSISPLFTIATVLSGLIVALGGLVMPVRTPRGVRTLEHLEGFKRYLSVAEKDRLAFHNAPERTPTLFDQYLPYAIALGVEKAWAAQFADVYQREPSWYAGGHTHAFVASALAADLTSFTQDLSTAMAPQHSGAHGGGSVGGGFGGGGGGSW